LAVEHKSALQALQNCAEASTHLRGLSTNPPFHLPAGSCNSFTAVVFSESDSLSTMSDHIYKKLELVGSSPNSIEEAVRNAISRAAKTIRNMRWLEVIETRAHIQDGHIDHWQVTVKVGFTLDQ
jgi:flavin-binding protein dodecin